MRAVRIFVMVALIVVCSIALSIQQAHPARALTSTTTHIDDVTAVRGVTLHIDERFHLGIPSQAVQANTKVTLATLDPSICPPSNGEVDAVSYRIEADEEHIIGRALWFTAKFPIALTVSVFSRSTTEESWVEREYRQRSPTSIDLQLRDSNGELCFTTTDEAGPLQTNDQPSPAAYIAIQPTTQKTLYAFHADDQRPIASLTKMITASVLLDLGIEWERTVAYASSDDRPGARVRLLPGDEVTVRDLFYTMLLGSANNATETLVRTSGISRTDFLTLMNNKAKNLGLQKTLFVDTTGLDPNTVSTAREYAKLAAKITKNPFLLKTMTRRTYRFRVKNRTSVHTIENTNKLLASSLYVLAGKTGYLDEAGHCLMVKTRDRVTGKSILTVVLGGQTSPSRFTFTKTLNEKAAALL